jgi:arginase
MATRKATTRPEVTLGEPKHVEKSGRPAVDLIAVPYFLGRRRAGMGRTAEALLAAGIETALPSGSRRRTVRRRRAIVTEASATFDVLAETARMLRSSLGAQRLPLVLAGNCMVGLAIRAALEGDPSYFWFDAHADSRTPDTSRDGFLDAMGLAMLIGKCYPRLTATIPGFRPLPEKRLLHLGVRQPSPGETALLSTTAVRMVPGAELRANAWRRTLGAALAPHRGHDSVVHIDLDVLDPTVGIANEYAERGGPSLERLLHVLEVVVAETRVRAILLACYDPRVDPERRVATAAWRIAHQLTRNSTSDRPTPTRNP